MKRCSFFCAMGSKYKKAWQFYRGGGIIPSVLGVQKKQLVGKKHLFFPGYFMINFNPQRPHAGNALQVFHHNFFEGRFLQEASFFQQIDVLFIFLLISRI